MIRAGWVVLTAIAAVSLGELALWGALDRSNDALVVWLATALLGVAFGGAAAVAARVLPPAAAVGLALVLPLEIFVRHALLEQGLAGRRLEAAAWGLALVAALVLARITVRRSGAALVAGLAGIALLLSVPQVLDAWPSARSGADAEAAKGRPDVVLLVMDTTRRDRLSLYGHDRPTSPALERIAQQAQVYEDAWSVAPWTPSSHASMFTGLLPGEHGVDGQDGAPFAEGLETLAGVLGRNGYRTAGFPANPNLHAEGWDRDFDVYHPPWLVGSHTLLALLNRRWIGTSFEPRHRAPFEWTADRSTPRVFALARSWWRIQGDAPRFLFLNLLDPHYPYHPPESDRQRFLPDLSPEQSYAVVQDVVHHTLARDLSAEDTRILRGLYDAEVASMDREIGRFVDWLEARGDLDDTILVITSDHGERLGERGTVGHLLEMDQHLLRVPLLVRFPGQLPPGRIEARARLDGLPGHLLGLAGVGAPEAMGRTPLAGGALAVAQHRYFGWFVERLQKRSPGFDASPYRGDWTFVADPRFALLWAPVQGAESGRLVDFHADPDGVRDLSARRPEVRARLQAVAAGLPPFVEADSRPPDAALRKRLRALGYAD